MSDRPQYNGPEVIEMAAKRLLPRVMEWLSKDGGSEDAAEEVAEQLAKAIRYDEDGFKLACTLENMGYWDADAGLVDILDSCSHYKWEARAELVKKWVVDNGILAPFKIGSTVKTATKGEGVISDVRPDTAEYVVQTKERTWSGDKTGWVLPVEECEAA